RSELRRSGEGADFLRAPVSGDVKNTRNRMAVTETAAGGRIISAHGEEESSARDAKRRYTARSSGSARDRAAVLRCSAAVFERGFRLVCSGGTGGRRATFTANFSIFKPETTRASAMIAAW